MLMHQGVQRIRLAEAALLFAGDHYPGLNPTCWLHRCDQLSDRVRDLHATSPQDRIHALRHVLVEQEAFSGNTEHYYDARNSLLNEVLHRKLGNPISLSVIWLDVAQALGWPVTGVGLPGHFIIKYHDDGTDTLIDPFHEGRIVTPGDCEKLVHRSCGQRARLTRTDFSSACTKSILTRMLNNLRVIFIQQQNWARAARVVDRLIAIHPQNEDLRCERKQLLCQLARMN